MRLHIGVVPGGGRRGQTALVFTEHQKIAPSAPGGRMEVERVVVHVERLSPLLEEVRDRVIEIAEKFKHLRPCFFIDATSGTGAGLVRILAQMQRRATFPQDIHRPHAYIKRGVARQGLVNAIVEVYGGGKLGFAPRLPMHDELIKALESYESRVSEDGKVSYEGDEELVLALGLSLAYPTHGAEPRYRTRSGDVKETSAAADDPYL